MDKKAQKEQILQWMALKGEITALKKQVKALEAQSGQFESTIIPMLKELDEQAYRVDAVMVRVKTRAGRTTVKWKPLFEKTYALVHAQVKRIVDGYRKQLTSEGKPKEYLEIEEAPPEKLGGFYSPKFQTRVARLNSALSGVFMSEFKQDEDHVVRALAVLASDDINHLRQAVVLDDSSLVQKAAVIKLSRLAPALVAPLKETAMAKYAQEGDLHFELNKLELMIDILEEIVEEI
jgi:hypothetical protein